MKRDTMCISFHLAPYIAFKTSELLFRQTKSGCLTAIRLNADQREDEREGELVKNVPEYNLDEAPVDLELFTRIMEKHQKEFKI